MSQLLPILLLLLAIALVVRRLPKVELGHSPAFLHRRFLNWFPVGLTYAFLYMGRYNLNVCKTALGDVMSKADFGTIFAAGTWTYAISFLINGPLTDRFGGRRTIMVAAFGSAAANVAMGLVIASGQREGLVPILSVLYAVNMYFQSFGAVSIVKVNSAWFHVRERGTFGGIFGILISLGIYFAYDWGRLIVTNLPTEYVFFIPAAILTVFLVIDYFLVRDTPGQAGHRDFDTADASSGDTGPQLGAIAVFKRMLSNPIIVTIALVEFCSGYLRNAIMQFYPFYAADTGTQGHFVASNWGLMLCIAGILGGMFAGVISDRVFHSRRGPVSAVLYGGMMLGSIAMYFALGTAAIGWVVAFMSLCIIGVHGMLSGTASMDFGGKRNVGVAVGIIDGFVYLGTAAEAIVLGLVLPGGDAKQDPANWWSWPVAMMPITLVGFLLALKVWNARPKAAAPAR
jgi:OPA family glycerol-3-phosphate transporter-like MFS transporter